MVLGMMRHDIEELYQSQSPEIYSTNVYTYMIRGACIKRMPINFIANAGERIILGVDCDIINHMSEIELTDVYSLDCASVAKLKEILDILCTLSDANTYSLFVATSIEQYRSIVNGSYSDDLKVVDIKYLNDDTGKFLNIVCSPSIDTRNTIVRKYTDVLNNCITDIKHELCCIGFSDDEIAYVIDDWSRSMKED